MYIGGASRGIGKAIAVSFARGGASLIAISARSVASLEPVAEELKAVARDAEALRVVCVPLEASSPQSVAAAADTVARELGGRPLDVVVQNAAVLGNSARITDADPDEWWRVYEVNVKGQFLAARYFLPLLLQGEGGLRTFVTVASVGAHLVGEGYSHYQSSKLANLRISEFVDSEYGAEGVSAWCVHPGNVLTDMAGGIDGEVAKTMSKSEFFCPCHSPLGAYVSYVCGEYVLMCDGAVFVDTPQISADTIVYLAAEKRQWLSGRYINCTWDMPELLAQEEEIVKGDKLKVRIVL